MSAQTFPAVTTRSGWRAAGAELTRRVRAVRERACVELALDVAPAAQDPREMISLLTSACVRELRTRRPDAARTVVLAELAADLQSLADELSDRAMVTHARRLADCERGLVRLREITTTAGLIDGVCDELIRSLGFARTMLARVESGMWRPWKANASMLDEPWVPDWIDQAIALDDLTLESRMLREHRPALVRSTNIPGVAQMVHAASVTSYVAAPIMPGGLVVGFFHADHGADGRMCDIDDRDILWAFAEGFGHLYERTALLEQLQTRREQVREAVSGINRAMDELTDTDLELARDLGGGIDPGPRVHPARQVMGTLLSALTPRELETLDLVVAGASNAEIAERLVITVGTVKSHVKSILAKLGVVNRSQAIALYLGAQDGSRH